MLQATEGILKFTLQYKATAIPAAWHNIPPQEGLSLGLS
jgi:hypothetical protein